MKHAHCKIEIKQVIILKTALTLIQLMR